MSTVYYGLVRLPEPDQRVVGAYIEDNYTGLVSIDGIWFEKDPKTLVWQSKGELTDEELNSDLVLPMGEGQEDYVIKLYSYLAGSIIPTDKLQQIQDRLRPPIAEEA